LASGGSRCGYRDSSSSKAIDLSISIGISFSFSFTLATESTSKGSGKNTSRENWGSIDTRGSSKRCSGKSGGGKRGGGKRGGSKRGNSWGSSIRGYNRADGSSNWSNWSNCKCGSDLSADIVSDWGALLLLNCLCDSSGLCGALLLSGALLGLSALLCDNIGTLLF